VHADGNIVCCSFVAVVVLLREDGVVVPAAAAAADNGPVVPPTWYVSFISRGTGDITFLFLLIGRDMTTGRGGGIAGGGTMTFGRALCMISFVFTLKIGFDYFLL